MSANTQRGYLDMSLLRFSTAGSVDDGKSTLIGRLLYDSKAIFQDQMEALEASSRRRGEEEVNLALLTDGLRAEREQGITIDVAYRYFATPKRKFIIADTPGHIQYTRNMVTGASTVNLSIILVDARLGVLEQTLRHTYLAHLLNIPHIIFAINKMDLVDFKQDAFEKIKSELKTLISKIGAKDPHFIPICAKDGDNVVEKSEKMPWYQGETLLEVLENVDITNDNNLLDARFPVQYVIRPHSKDAALHDYRGYAGRVASGVFKVGDEVQVMSNGRVSKITAIDIYKDTLQESQAGDSVTICIADDIDISRGDMLAPVGNVPQSSQELSLMVCWFQNKQLPLGGKFILRHTSNEVRCMIKDINFKVNINTLDQDTTDKSVNMNDIASISIKTTKPLYFDSYSENRVTGSVILIDEGTNETVAAGMII